ncbi:hypothetical protein KAM338_28970 [Aeromonas caviae]|jgi:hypothetical protein|uniref:Uncharacterized protein n=4 Tax=Aeromonas TaxID=642 RepID=A0A189PG36_AERSS|nr:MULTISPECIES: hypothetical protein [Gammaproteobacteria]ABO92310.1 hypothetical protein ASA_P4G007 [Aeromonas salmonicida subsp. salmonicida A449]ALL42163.1 hypothetical protein [Aeromonas salmonicida subsp. salmonicida]AYV36901.1 hypothetical protein EFI48_08775 [Aeromonas veronii]EHA1065694.1 hypothetical protein [Aeromonas hydrophila]EHA1069345.1 hypothetical protein [Aeromonas hydrophila]
MKVTPEGWVVLRIPPDEKEERVGVFKIFASWRQDDRWRLSSGTGTLSTIARQGDFLVWKQSSGNDYWLPFDGENGMTFYTCGVLENMLNALELDQGEVIIHLLRDGQFDYEELRHLEF